MILGFLTSILVWDGYDRWRSDLLAAGMLACVNCWNNSPTLNHETNLFLSVTILWKLILCWWNQVKNMWFWLANSMQSFLRSWRTFLWTCACVQICVCVTIHTEEYMHLPILKVMGSLVFSFYIYLVLNICTTVDKIITLITKYLYVYYNRTNIQFHLF